METTTPTPYRYPELTTAPLIMDFLQRVIADQTELSVYLTNGVKLQGVILQADDKHLVMVGQGRQNIVSLAAVATLCLEV